MESLELCKGVLAEWDKTKLSYYYDNFKYRAVLYLQYIEHFRNAKTSNDFLKSLGKKVYFGYTSYRSSNLVRDAIDKECPENYSLIEQFVSWREHKTVESKDVKIRINFSYLTLYFNDFQNIKDLHDAFTNLGKSFKYNYSNAIPNFKKGVIYHKEPKNKFRLFLKPTRLYDSDKEDFIKFLNSYKFNLSQSLKNSILFRYRTLSNRNHLNIQSNHYLDYDDESLLTILAMMYPNLIRKICTIEKY